LKDRLAKETGGMPFGELMKNLWYDNIIRNNSSENKACIELAMSRMEEADDENGKELWSIVAIILVKYVLYYDKSFGQGLIDRYLHRDGLVHNLVFQITDTLDPHQPDNEYDKNDQLLNDLFAILQQIIDSRFDLIVEKGITADEAGKAFRVIDSMIQRLYFTVSAGAPGVRDVPVTTENCRGFYKKLMFLLDSIVRRSTGVATGFMVAHTGYYFMQILIKLIDEDPTHILFLANKIVQCAAKNGFTYDVSTLGEVVKLTELYIADHKEVLYQKENFNQLIVILDLFANSGWQDALELTWQLKDAL
jgi:hypothetical protein